MTNESFPEPWQSFLREIDAALDAETNFHCFGGFAITTLFGLPRPTEDVDIISAVVRDNYEQLYEIAGKGSPLHKKHSVYLDLVGAVAIIPDDYEYRLINATPSSFKNLRILVMEPHDVVLSKVSRNAPKDIEDVKYLAQAANLDGNILLQRFEKEVIHSVIGPPERTLNNLKYFIRLIAEIQELRQ